MSATINGDQQGTVGLINSMTAQNTTSGTSIDFTGIPAGVKRITVMLNGVSTNGTSPLLVRIGSGSIQTTGYDSTVSAGTTAGLYDNSTVGFLVTYPGASASDIVKGILTLVAMGGNIWVEAGNAGSSANQLVTSASCGSVTLSGTLDRVRLTTVNGTNSFDAGSVNILYE